MYKHVFTQQYTLQELKRTTQNVLHIYLVISPPVLNNVSTAQCALLHCL